ncbi:hypothetical protein EDC56_2324 [Sinobacterium caligoides]|uniref:DUF1508 domain-containing protein n=1 Tax=Sinobacterium caligoides TaxID=933926 RepID=A0A3N2DRF0_9GAMM|nr:hypothetical protein [Sinobacterium caligoides]ROS01875.1 hypothetical protein EDC56_2324 [Sinobacterium caligoides]
MDNSISETITDNGKTLTIKVTENDQGWWLEIVSSNDNITNYEDAFESEQAALEEARAAVAECGVDSFFW